MKKNKKTIRNGAICAFSFVLGKLRERYERLHPNTKISLIIEVNTIIVLSNGKVKESLSINSIKDLK